MTLSGLFGVGHGDEQARRRWAAGRSRSSSASRSRRATWCGPLAAVDRLADRAHLPDARPSRPRERRAQPGPHRRHLRGADGRARPGRLRRRLRGRAEVELRRPDRPARHAPTSSSTDRASRPFPRRARRATSHDVPTASRRPCRSSSTRSRSNGEKSNVADRHRDRRRLRASCPTSTRSTGSRATTRCSQRLGPGDVLIEEQFAEGARRRRRRLLRGRDALGRHGDADRGRRSTATRPILQGSIVTDGDARSRSRRARDPITMLVSVERGRRRRRRPGARSRRRLPTVSRRSRSRTRPSTRTRSHGQLDQIVYLLYALLAMSVVISLFGIANSLFLSIHERTGELGVLRAIGATTRPGPAGDPLRERDHLGDRRRARHRRRDRLRGGS